MTKTVDIDRDAVTSGLRLALADSGMSQAAFAHALGTSGSRFSTYISGRTVPSAVFYLRSLRIGSALRQAREQHRMTPPNTVTAIRTALGDGDEMWALKMLLQGRDHLGQMLDRGLDSADAWQGGPGTTGARSWDRLLAAVVAHEHVERGCRPPAWTSVDRGDDPCLFLSPFFGADEIPAQTPAWLAERGIFIAGRDLVTV